MMQVCTRELVPSKMTKFHHLPEPPPHRNTDPLYAAGSVEECTRRMEEKTRWRDCHGLSTDLDEERSTTDTNSRWLPPRVTKQSGSCFHAVSGIGSRGVRITAQYLRRMPGTRTLRYVTRTSTSQDPFALLKPRPITARPRASQPRSTSPGGRSCWPWPSPCSPTLWIRRIGAFLHRPNSGLRRFRRASATKSSQRRSLVPSGAARRTFSAVCGTMERTRMRPSTASPSPRSRRQRTSGRS